MNRRKSIKPTKHFSKNLMRQTECSILQDNGLKGKHVIDSMRIQLKTKLPENITAKTYHTSRRLSFLFQIKNNDRIFKLIILKSCVMMFTLVRQAEDW